MTWDALQREMLKALGHTLYVTVDATAMRVEEEPVEVRAAGPSVQDRNASGARDIDRSVRPRDASAPGSLMRALLRAANLGENDVATLQSDVPPLDLLTGNSDAKRKLWPMLRALRAQRRM